MKYWDIIENFPSVFYEFWEIRIIINLIIRKREISGKL